MNIQEIAEAVKRLLVGTNDEAPPCTDDIFKRGVMVLKLAGPRGYLIERYVIAARERAKVSIDWHFAGGIAIIMALPGEEEKATTALEYWMPAFQEAARQEVGRDGGYEVQIFGWCGPRPPKLEELPPNALAVDGISYEIMVKPDED